MTERICPIDFRFYGSTLQDGRGSRDRSGGLRAQGVRVGPGSRMPRLPALYRPKRRWRLASQTDPRSYLDEEDHSAESAWRRNCATVQPLAKEVYDVLDDQTRRGMLIRLPEQVAKEKYPQPRGCIAWCQPEGQAERRGHSQSPSRWHQRSCSQHEDKTAGPGAFTYLSRPQKSNARKGQAGLQHVCSYGRCERGASPDPYRPEGLALARLSIGARRRCLH